MSLSALHLPTFGSICGYFIMKYVIVGLSVGKSKVIKFLENRGFKTIPEPCLKNILQLRAREPQLECDLFLQRQIKYRFIQREWVDEGLHERSIKDVEIFTKGLKAKYPGKSHYIDNFIFDHFVSVDSCDNNNVIYFYLRTTGDINYDTYWKPVSAE